MAHPNSALITRFYEAFARRDGAAMSACYHPDARFSDPAFVGLRGVEVGGMWRMLTSRARDFKLEFSNVQADAERGSADWLASYLFSATGRKVVNRIHAEFRFKDGLILDHVDQFSFWTWARQALGAPGLLLGWTPFLKAKVQKTARKGLLDFLEKGG